MIPGARIIQFSTKSLREVSSVNNAEENRTIASKQPSIEIGIHRNEMCARAFGRREGKRGARYCGDEGFHSGGFAARGVKSDLATRIVLGVSSGSFHGPTNECPSFPR